MQEVDENSEWLMKRITDIKAGIAIMEQQVKNPHEGKIWIKSMKRQNIGKDLAEMAHDVRHFTETGHKDPPLGLKRVTRAPNVTLATPWDITRHK